MNDMLGGVLVLLLIILLPIVTVLLRRKSTQQLLLEACGASADPLATVQKMKSDLQKLNSLKPLKEREKKLSLKLDELQVECYKQFKDIEFEFKDSKKEALLKEVSHHFYGVEKGLRGMYLGDEAEQEYSSTHDAPMSFKHEFLLVMYSLDSAYEEMPIGMQAQASRPLKLSDLKTWDERRNYFLRRHSLIEEIVNQWTTSES